MVRDLWLGLRRLIAGLMLAAAMSFVLQGVAAAAIDTESGRSYGVTVWHSHAHDGADYVHAHDVDPGALDHDHDGKVPGLYGVGTASLPSPLGLLGAIAVLAGDLVMASPGIHGDAFLDGLRRPPRPFFTG